MRCFFHADDYGLTPAMSRDILECIDAGRLQSVSIIANAAYAETAMESLKLRQHINIAVHLNIVEGRALSASGRIPGLTDANGNFAGNIPVLCAQLALRRTKKIQKLLDAIEAEFRAQIDKVQSAFPGAPLHIDGHLHMYAMPPLQGVLASILQSYPVAYVRVPDDARCALPGSLAFQCAGMVRQKLLARWSAALRPLLQRHGATSSHFFISAFASGYMTLQRLESSLQHVARLAKEDDLVEIMLHPGGAEADDVKSPSGKDMRFRRFYCNPNRAIEKSLLLSGELPALLKKYGARICRPNTLN